jgi:hypothetical protein
VESGIDGPSGWDPWAIVLFEGEAHQLVAFPRVQAYFPSEEHPQ